MMEETTPSILDGGVSWEEENKTLRSELIDLKAEIQDELGIPFPPAAAADPVEVTRYILELTVLRERFSSSRKALMTL